MKTGNTCVSDTTLAGCGAASMEPGHEDREYVSAPPAGCPSRSAPQWSPAMKTGNTSSTSASRPSPTSPQWSPAMKTGNTRARPSPSLGGSRLNGARP